MVTLRTYRIEDEETVVTLWWDSWHSIRAGLRHPQSLADWRRRWAKDIVSRQQIVVAEADGVVVGFAAADLCNRVLDQIFVAPPHKRCGIDRQLLSWAAYTTARLPPKPRTGSCGSGLEAIPTTIGCSANLIRMFYRAEPEPNWRKSLARHYRPRPDLRAWAAARLLLHDRLRMAADMAG